MKQAVWNMPERIYGNRFLIWILSFFLGHLLGVLCSGSASEPFLSGMHTAAGCRVSIIGLLSSVGLPFLLAAWAVYIRCPFLLVPIAFGKAFSFSCVGYRICTAWGDAGWLVAGLMMFGTLFSMPVLCWYCRCHIGGRDFSWVLFFMALACLVVIGIVDYCWIAPFLINIITF